MRGSFYYYLLFRLCRNFLNNYLEIKISNFKILASYQSNKTSYYLLKKCHFGDDYELETIKKFSKLNKMFLLDCGANYGFYSFYTGSLSSENKIIAFLELVEPFGIVELARTGTVSLKRGRSDN